MTTPLLYNTMILRIGRLTAAWAEQPPAPAAPPQAVPKAMTDIHDIKPALAFGPDLYWLYWALALLAVSALALLAWRMWRARKKQRVMPTAPALLAPEAEAYQMLDLLAADGFLDPKLFYFRLSAIVRRYIERRFQIPAAEMTTEELLPRIDQLPLRIEISGALKDFCRTADPIKFAGVPVDRDRMTHDLVFARNFVSQTAGRDGSTPADAADDALSGRTDLNLLTPPSAETWSETDPLIPRR